MRLIIENYRKHIKVQIIFIPMVGQRIYFIWGFQNRTLNGS